MNPTDKSEDQILIIGSGPAGVMAAWGALRNNKSVHLIDFGNNGEEWRSNLPDEPFENVLRILNCLKEFSSGSMGKELVLLQIGLERN